MFLPCENPKKKALEKEMGLYLLAFVMVLKGWNNKSLKEETQEGGTGHQKSPFSALSFLSHFLRIDAAFCKREYLQVPS